MEISSRRDMAAVESRMRSIGFRPDPEGPICRWLFGELKVDLMPADPSILGFSSRWYPEVLLHAARIQLEGIDIRIASPPYFLATKVEAFADRGASDPYASVDLEDVISLIDGREELVRETIAAMADVSDFIAAGIGALLDRGDIEVLVASHLPGDEASQARAGIVLARMRELARR